MELSGSRRSMRGTWPWWPKPGSQRHRSSHCSRLTSCRHSRSGSQRSSTARNASPPPRPRQARIAVEPRMGNVTTEHSHDEAVYRLMKRATRKLDRPSRCVNSATSCEPGQRTGWAKSDADRRRFRGASRRGGPREVWNPGQLLRRHLGRDRAVDHDHGSGVVAQPLVSPTTSSRRGAGPRASGRASICRRSKAIRWPRSQPA